MVTHAFDVVFVEVAEGDFENENPISLTLNTMKGLFLDHTLFSLVDVSGFFAKRQDATPRDDMPKLFTVRVLLERNGFSCFYEK
jgi:hypothetical protein